MGQPSGGVRVMVALLLLMLFMQGGGRVMVVRAQGAQFKPRNGGGNNNNNGGGGNNNNNGGGGNNNGGGGNNNNNNGGGNNNNGGGGGNNGGGGGGNNNNNGGGNNNNNNNGGGNNNNNYKGVEGLKEDFYKASCPQLEQVIEQKLRSILQNDIGQAAGILRIMFHDCFVQGCDASILLVKPVTEQTATPNNASIRATSLRALDAIKESVEAVCPGVVSCADTVILSTKIAVSLVGGPSIPMKTGRRDSISAASNQTVINNIPPPTLSISALKQNFQNHGLDIKDLVSLSGGHSIGQAHCRFVDPQITPTVSTDLNAAFAFNLSRICLPTNNPTKARLTVHLDFITRDLFDNAYFKNVLAKVAIFHTDAELLNASDTMQLVQLYAQNQPLFFEQFSLSMVKMSQLGVLTGQQGVIRKKCTIPN